MVSRRRSGDAGRVEHVEMADEAFEAAAVTGRADHGVRARVPAVRQDRAVVVEPNDFADDPCLTGLEGVDEAVVDGGIDSGAAEAGHEPLGCSRDSVGGQVPVDLPLDEPAEQVDRSAWQVFGDQHGWAER